MYPTDRSWSATDMWGLMCHRMMRHLRAEPSCWTMRDFGGELCGFVDVEQKTVQVTDRSWRAVYAQWCISGVSEDDAHDTLVAVLLNLVVRQSLGHHIFLPLHIEDGFARRVYERIGLQSCADPVQSTHFGKQYEAWELTGSARERLERMLGLPPPVCPTLTATAKLAEEERPRSHSPELVASASPPPGHSASYGRRGAGTPIRRPSSCGRRQDIEVLHHDKHPEKSKGNYFLVRPKSAVTITNLKQGYVIGRLEEDAAGEEVEVVVRIFIPDEPNADEGKCVAFSKGRERAHLRWSRHWKFRVFPANIGLRVASSHSHQQCVMCCGVWRKKGDGGEQECVDWFHETLDLVPSRTGGLRSPPSDDGGDSF